MYFLLVHQVKSIHWPDKDVNSKLWSEQWVVLYKGRLGMAQSFLKSCLNMKNALKRSQFHLYRSCSS